MLNAADRGRPGEHAVYPGTFDPITPGHLDIIEKAGFRLLGERQLDSDDPSDAGPSAIYARGRGS
jgi:hypothetical protein